MVPPGSYPFNTKWPRADTLVESARTPRYRAVFAEPFSTYILTVYSVGRPDHYWIHGINDAQARNETRQFHELASHLLTEYRGSGKTFVLQHWEGDWAAPGSFDSKKDPSDAEFRGMIADHMPDRPPFGPRNVYVGEFGAPENDWPSEKVDRTLRNVTKGRVWDFFERRLGESR